ncbi:MAG: MOSC domain-containing protein [Bacteroidetes bacterium]|nr:MOSC domain-containing protein [Bacteroidota bacterium]
MGKLTGIGYKREKRGTVITCEKAFVGLQSGVEDDIRGIPGKRQVTVLSAEAFEMACKQLETSLAWTVRRANLLIEGIDLQGSTGKQLLIGEVVLEITGETEPCYRMDEQCEGLKEALQTDWRGGVTCMVICEGHIRLNDSVQLIEATHE